MSAAGRLYLEPSGSLHAIGDLIAPEHHEVAVSWMEGINDKRQIVAKWGHAVLLTPLGEMIIPGDVQVDLDDLCAFLLSPIDLDGDGAVDSNDQSWLVARLAVWRHFANSGVLDDREGRLSATDDPPGVVRLTGPRGARVRKAPPDSELGLFANRLRQPARQH